MVIRSIPSPRNRPGGTKAPEHTLSTAHDRDARRAPGWSLAEPFNLANSLIDVARTAQRAAELARSHDGSPEHIAAGRLIRDVLRRLAARIEQHSAEWDR